ncbi:4272_t:CDS:2, partial [Racocetra fulgida]
LREEFERQARLKKEHEVENMGDIQLSIDATQLFDPYDSVPYQRQNVTGISSIFENIEVGSSVVQPRITTAKANYTFGADGYVSNIFSLWGQNDSYSRRERSSVTIGINRAMEKSGYGLEMQVCDGFLC